MKLYLLTALVASSLFTVPSFAQGVAPDQNPQFEVSRSKYMKGADSLNVLHGTTVHQTYKAFDWYENKMEAKRERVQFRRELRTLRARPYYNQGYYYDPYRPYNRFQRNYRDNRFFWWF